MRAELKRTTAVLPEAERTIASTEVEVLALFSSPTKRGNQQLAPLQLMKEVQALTEAVPQRHILIKAAAEWPGSIAQTIKKYSPRLIQFSGHGDAVKRGAHEGALAFEKPDGQLHAPDPEEFIALLKLCPRLEGVFLNGCNTMHPLGERIKEALPHLTIIGWETISDDRGASCFAKGFYDALGSQYHGVRLVRRMSIADAYEKAKQTFHQGGYRVGDPGPYRNFPRGMVTERRPVSAEDATVQYEVKLRRPGANDQPSVIGMAESPTDSQIEGLPFAVAPPSPAWPEASMVYIVSAGATPAKLKPTVHGKPALLVGTGIDPMHTSTLSGGKSDPKSTQQR